MAVIVLQWTPVILLIIHLHVAFTEVRSAAGCLGAIPDIHLSCASSEYMNITDIRVAVTKQKVPSFCNAPLTDESHCAKSVTDRVRNIFIECNSHSSCTRAAYKWMDDGVLADCPDDFTGDKYIVLYYHCFTKDSPFFTLHGDYNFQSRQSSVYVRSPDYGRLLVNTHEFCQVSFHPLEGPEHGYYFIIQGIEGYSSLRLVDNKPTCAYQLSVSYIVDTENNIENHYLCPDNVGRITAYDPRIGGYQKRNTFNMGFYGNRRLSSVTVSGRFFLKIEVMMNGTGNTLIPANGFILLLCEETKFKTAAPGTSSSTTATTLAATTLATTTPATTSTATTTSATTTAATTTKTATTTTTAPITHSVAASVPPVTTTSPSSGKSHVVTGVSTVSRIPATSTNTDTSHSLEEKQVQLDEELIEDDSRGTVNSNFLYYIVGGGGTVGFLLVAAVIIAFIIMRRRQQDEQKVELLEFSQTPEAAGEENQSKPKKDFPIISL